ncbi:MAG: lipoyl(octanoyl) transferase, partial [Actinomycetota bacterium]|nr:lipoyl(octanoyl) transferase [Actinomycetota bacterium]
YNEGWELQERLHAQVVSRETVPTILLLEHAHVYTAGTRTQPADLPPAHEPLVEVNRGGRITWHGPGQVVAYPIVPLPNPVDVVAFVRSLEAALMATCTDLGLDTVRIDGRSGVWVAGTDSDGAGVPRPARKIAAIGVRVARGVAMHGVALNVDCDLAAYGAIVPCGIADAGVTSLAAEGVDLPGPQPVAEVGTLLGTHLRNHLSWD